MTITPSDVLGFAPELASINSGLMQVYIDLAKNFVSEIKWGLKYKQGVCLLTAHFLTLQARGSSAGAITSESVGELAVSYSAPTDDQELKSTTYGAMYFLLRKTLKITPLVV